MDNNIFATLARCRVLELQQAKKYLRVTEQELDLLCEVKLLSKEYIKNNFNVSICYYLTSKGEQYVHQNIRQIKELYRGFILEHDLRLCDFYLSRTVAEQESWMTRDDLIKKYKLNGAVDGAFTNINREFEGIEIMSKTAKPDTLEKTENFIAESGIQKMNYVLY